MIPAAIATATHLDRGPPHGELPTGAVAGRGSSGPGPSSGDAPVSRSVVQSAQADPVASAFSPARASGAETSRTVVVLPSGQ